MLKSKRRRKYDCVLTRMDDGETHSLFSVYSYNPHDFNGSWVLWGLSVWDSIMRRRFVCIVMRLRIWRRILLFCSSWVGRGGHFLNGWDSMSLTGQFHCLCAPLRVERSSWISTSHAQEEMGRVGALGPGETKNFFSSGLSGVWRQSCVKIYI